MQTVSFPQAHAQLELGSQCLRGVKLQKLLGAGTYGVVYGACDIKAKCHYAVKIQLLRSAYDVRAFAIEVAFTKLASDKQFGPQLYVEHTCASSCSASGAIVCKSMPAGSPQAKPLPKIGILITMRYPVVYSTKAAPRPYKRLKATIVAMHKQGVVHSDLLPKNVVMNQNGTDVKLIDWGVSFAYNVPASHPLSFASRTKAFTNWYESALAQYMIPYFPQFYQANAEDVVYAIVQWGALLGFDYREQLLPVTKAHRTENVAAYLRRFSKPSHLMLIDWALPYTEWRRHAGIRVRIQLSADTTGTPNGVLVALFVNRQDRFSYLVTRLVQWMRFNKQFTATPTRFLLRGKEVDSGMTLHSLGYKADDIIVNDEEVSVEPMQE